MLDAQDRLGLGLPKATKGARSQPDKNSVLRARLFFLVPLIYGLLLHCHPPAKFERLFDSYRQIYPRLSTRQSASPCREETSGLLERWHCPALQDEARPSQALLSEGTELRRGVEHSGTAGKHRRLALWYLVEDPKGAGLDAAIDQLGSATEADPANALLWSDLAALDGWKASLTQNPRLIQDAFHAVERAFKLAPDRPEVLFNRAWILESLQLPRAAREAWEYYLHKEAPASPWRREAQERLRRLETPTLVETWNTRNLDRDLSEGQLIDARAAIFAKAVPSSALRWVTTSLLPAWGEAWRTGDWVAANRHLHAARIVADLYKEEWGDTLLADGISEIESTVQTGSTQQTARLIKGIVAFRGAIEDHERSRPGSALVGLGTALGGFRGNAEAFQDLAVDYEAASLYAQGKYEQARDRLRDLSRKITGHSYLYLRAKILHRQGSIENVSGNPEQARRCLHEALTIFEHFSDAEHIAFVNSLLGESYNELGDRQRAWKYLYQALVQNRRLGLAYRETQIYNTLADFTLRSGDAELSYLYQDAAVQASSSLDNPSVVGPMFGNFCYPFLVGNTSRREHEGSCLDSPFA